MSWNVAQFDILESKKNPATKNKMVELIQQCQPDIACFQEMVAGDSDINLNTPYYKKYSFFSVSDFTQLLHFRDHFYSYNFTQDFLSSQHFGLIIFSRYPIVNRQKISFLSKGYNNFFQFVDIVKNNDTIRVFNIHLQSLKFNRTNRDYIDNPTFENSDDMEQSKNILAKFKWAFTKRKIQTYYVSAAIKQSPYPVIVCGDFNDVPNSYAYQKIGDGLQNCFVEKGYGIGRTFSDIAPTLRIDNIFVARAFTVDQFSRINKLLSDHFPIITDVLLNKE
jgi:endonuclease/exonuclease/phosphatase family metal-dependent hydrolase